MALPSIGMEIGDWKRHRRILVRRSPFPCSMRTMKVEVGPEIEQFVFKIRSRPEQRAIQILASYRTDPSFHKGMRQRSQVDGFDLGHLQDPQIGLPLPEPIKGIMAAAEVLRHPALPSKGPVEHPAKSGPIDGSGLNPEPPDAAREWIHDGQNPVGPGFPLRLEEKSRLYFRFFRAWWKLKRVEGFSTIAERIRRVGRIRRAQKAATR